MSEFEPPAPGWWRAPDDNWYPPESHPGYQQPMIPAPPGPQPPPPTAFQQPQDHPRSAPSKPWWQRWWAIGAGVVLALLVAAGIAGSGDDQAAVTNVPAVSNGGESDQENSTDTGESESDTTEVPAGDTSQIEAVAAENDNPNPTPSPAEQLGTLERPLAFDASVPVTFSTFGDADGSVWNVSVGPPREISNEVLDANQFNDPPPDGIVFAGFEVEMTLASADKEPLSPGFNFTWEVLGGSSAAVYDSTTIDGIFGCGVTANDFEPFSEVFVAGTLTGIVCIPIPQEDVSSAETSVAMNFGGDRIVFAVDGASPAPAPITQTGEAAESYELGYGTSVPVTFSAFGDADDSVWNVTVDLPRDITEDVLGENDFNDPPPEGVRFVGFDVEMTLATAGKEPLSPGFNFTWELLGGATAAVYDETTMSDLFGCGVIPNEFDNFAEVFVGGTLKGTVCIPLPIEDLAHAETGAAMNFGGDRVIFADDAPTPPSAPIGPAGGPAAIGESLPLATSTELRWDTLGDADRSTWTTAVAGWRDMTAETLNENSFNDSPADGVLFVGFDIDMTLLSADKEPLSAGFNFSWEILGGATNRVYDAGTLSESFGCGVIPGDFDMFAEVFASGTLMGTVCIPVPIEDFSHPDTRISMNFSGDRVTFAPNE